MVAALTSPAPVRWLPADIPWLESVAARVGVAALVLWSTYVGFTFWISRDETLFAYLTIAAEIIAFAGLGVARHHWKDDRRFACGAAALTLLAATWCGLTMYEKIAADARARVLAEAAETLPYKLASDDLTQASQGLRQRLRESPPLGMGPQAIAAWEVSQARAVGDLTKARDDAQARLAAATPEIKTDWLAIVRGVGIEIIKLFGFLCFRVAVDARKMQAAFGLGVIATTGMVETTVPAPAPVEPVSHVAELQPAAQPPSATFSTTHQPVAQKPGHGGGSIEDEAIFWLKAGEAVRAVARHTGLSRYRVGQLAEANGLVPLIRSTTGRTAKSMTPLQGEAA